jgi:hypothetical protein
MGECNIIFFEKQSDLIIKVLLKSSLELSRDNHMKDYEKSPIYQFLENSCHWNYIFVEKFNVKKFCEVCGLPSNLFISL